MVVFRADFALLAAVLSVALALPAFAQADLETYPRRDVLGRGESITYYFGPGAPGDGIILDTELVFDDEGEDGVELSTSDEVAGVGRTSTGPGISCAVGEGSEEIVDLQGDSLGTFDVMLDCDAVPEVLMTSNNTSISITIDRVSSRVGGGPFPQTSPGGGNAQAPADGSAEDGQQAPRMPGAGAGGLAGKSVVPVVLVLLGMLAGARYAAMARR